MDSMSRLEAHHPQLLRQIRPPVPWHQWQSAETVMAVKFSMDCVSYARVTTSSGMRVLDWAFAPLSDDPEWTRASSRSKKGTTYDDKNFHLLYEQLRKVVGKKLPKADLVVYEENPRITKDDQFYIVKSQLHIVQAALVGLLNAGREENRVYGQGMSVLNRVFDVEVGLERIKLQSMFPGIVEDLVETIPDQWRTFNHQCPTSAVREQMATALLVAVAFSNVMKRNSGEMGIL